MRKTQTVALVLFVSCSVFLAVNFITETYAETSPSANRPKKIKTLKRIESTLQLPQGVGDNWYMTWAADDKQYAGLCDGTGFSDLPGYDGSNYNSKLFSIAGEPPAHTFSPVSGYPDLLSLWPSVVPGSTDYSRYYGFGIIAIDGTIYQLLSTPKFPFGPKGNAFIGAKMIYSKDNGRTWHNQDGTTPVKFEKWDERNRKNMLFFYEPDESFSLQSFLQMGQDYKDNKDGFVYLYAPNGNVDGKMNQLVLLRVKKETILDRTTYEYFRAHGKNGQAEWTRNINERGIVHEFPRGWVNYNIGPGHSGHPYSWQPTVVYNKALGLYMMANWGIGVGDDGDWFGKPSYLGFYTSANPWGPWTQVYEEISWCPGGDSAARAYQPVISPKWIAPDGKSFWLVWTDFRLVNNKRPYYAFNCQKVEIELE